MVYPSRAHPMATRKSKEQTSFTTPPPPIIPEVEHQAVADFARKAYLDYSMYVILDRALPHVADGLKPVQRRIVYAMSELGLGPGAKPKKSARTVGDVIGKFHPHGDSACYEAMVLMAQPFSMRYPLIDGQGNWGSPHDPKQFAEIREMYKTGNGSIRQRAKWEIEDGEIVISALPAGVSGAKVQQQIAAQMEAKKLPMVADVRDESDHESPTRLVIEPRSNRVDLDEVMNHLFATTDLERSYRVNMNIIALDGRPRLFALKELLLEWLEFRIETVRRRLQHRYDHVNARLHILDGYLVAYLNIDEVIRIIRREDEPKPVLMKRFKLSELQAESLLELRLRYLNKLQEMEIRGEQAKLTEERSALEKVLGSKKLLRKQVRDEVVTDVEGLGDQRKSPIVEREAAKALDP